MSVHNPRSRTKGFKPKGPLGEAIVARGRGKGNIWYTSGWKCNGDLILHSDAELRHFVLLEADPEVQSYALHEPVAIIKVGSDDLKTEFDADVRLRGGGRQFREIKATDVEPIDLSGRERLQFEAQELYAAAHGADYVRIGRQALLSSVMLASNWSEGLAYLLSARSLPLINYRLEISALLRHQGRCDVQALLSCYSIEDWPVATAALFSLLAEGVFGSDLAIHPWGRRTLVWVPTANPTVPDDHAQNSPQDLLQRAKQIQADRHAEHAARAAEDIAAAFARQPPPGRSWHTRKTLPPELADHRNWPECSEDVINSEAKEWARARRAAIIAYLDDQPVAAIAADTGVERSEVLRMLNRAITVDANGRLIGWRVLCKGLHLQTGVRRAPLLPGSRGGGLRGAFEHRLQQFPEACASMIDEILRTSGTISTTGLKNIFFKACREGGIDPREYPFCTKSRALPALRAFRKQVLEANPEKAATLLGGPGAGKRVKLNNGRTSLMAPFALYSVAGLDAHTLDLIGTVRFPTPKGHIWIPIQRLVILVVVERSTWAVLGYAIADGGGGGSAHDATEAVRHALSVWHPFDCENSVVTYPKGAGFPSGCIPELAGAVWSSLYVDNASNFTSFAVCERIRRRLGCAINFGPVGDWTRRFWVEGLFSALERCGFQRLPNTTGAGPLDVRRRNAEQQAVAMKFDLDDLIPCVDVALATCNGTPRASLGGRTVLEFLGDVVHDPKASFIPRRLPPLAPGQADLDVVVLHKRVRGNLSQGRRPYIEYLDAHYTNAILADCWELIGQRLWVHIRRDLRTITAFLDNGASLGELSASGGWSLVPHDEAVRREVKQRRAAGQIEREQGEEWPQALMRKKAEEAVQHHEDSHRRHATVSVKATQVGKLAHSTGLPIPEVPMQTEHLEETKPRAGRKCRSLPNFVKPWKRTADY